jgi:hypothetical protein
MGVRSLLADPGRVVNDDRADLRDAWAWSTIPISFLGWQNRKKCGREQLDDRPEVRLGLVLLLTLLAKLAIAEQLFADICGQKFHGSLLS